MAEVICPNVLFRIFYFERIIAQKESLKQINYRKIQRKIVKRKNIQSLIKLGLKVIFLRYAAAPQRIKYIKLLNPIGVPNTTSLNNPAIKI